MAQPPDADRMMQGIVDTDIMKRARFSATFCSEKKTNIVFCNGRDALRDGFAIRLPYCFDIPLPKIESTPGRFDTFSRNIPVTLSFPFDATGVWFGGTAARFDGLREWTSCRFINRYALWRWYSEKTANRYDYSPRSTVTVLGGGVYDLLAMRLEAAWNAYDSVTAFPRNGIRGRFNAYFGRPRLKLSALCDSLRFWTKDRYGGNYDLKIPFQFRLHDKFDAIFSRDEWPSTGLARAMYWLDRLNPRIHKNIARYNSMLALQPGIRAFGFFDVFERGCGAWPYHRQALVRPGWRILAKNIETEETFDLGFIDTDAENPTLEDVLLPDGDYEISVLTSSLFWRDCLERNIRTISIRPGVEVTPLPVIYNLRSAVSEGVTTIRWSANRSELDDCVFGVWYASESPVDVNRPPNNTVWYFSSQTEYATTFSQNAPAWVAVAAMRTGDEAEIGKVHELYLDWSNVPPCAPDDVMVLDAPWSAFDETVETRHEDDSFWSLWNG